MERFEQIPAYMEKVFDALAVSILWLLCCLPLVTVGAATAALYDTVHRVWKQGRGYAVESFFRSFKRNLKPGVALWAVLAGMMVAIQLNIGIVRALLSGNMGIFASLFYWLCLLLVWACQCYAFPALSRFDMPAGWVFKLSVYLIFRHLGRTVLLLAVMGAAVFAVYQSFWFLLVAPFAAQYVNHWILEPVLVRHVKG